MAFVLISNPPISGTPVGGTGSTQGFVFAKELRGFIFAAYDTRLGRMLPPDQGPATSIRVIGGVVLGGIEGYALG